MLKRWNKGMKNETINAMETVAVCEKDVRGENAFIELKSIEKIGKEMYAMFVVTLLGKTSFHCLKNTSKTRNNYYFNIAVRRSAIVYNIFIKDGDFRAVNEKNNTVNMNVEENTIEIPVEAEAVKCIEVAKIPALLEKQQKKWFNVDLPYSDENDIENAGVFQFILKHNEIEFEKSSKHGIVHFETFLAENELEKMNNALVKIYS